MNKGGRKIGNGNFWISDDGVWQQLSRPIAGWRERGVRETPRFEKKAVTLSRRGGSQVGWSGLS
jgi:hypothetical protein